MGEPLVIYECPKCGERGMEAEHCYHGENIWHTYPKTMQPVRVFREEDVRRLWGTYHTLLNRDVVSPGTKRIIQRTLDVFPAPEDWHG